MYVSFQNENVGRKVHSVQFYQHLRHPGRMAPTRILRPKTFHFRWAIWNTLFPRKKKQTNKISAAPLPIWAGLLQTVEPVTNRKLLYQPTYFPEEKLKERFFFIWFVILIWNFTLLMVQLHDFFIIFLQWPRQLLQFVGGLHWKDWLHFMGSLIDQSSIQQIYGFFRSHHIFIKVNDLQNHVTVSWFMIIKTYTLCRSSLDFSSFLIIKFMILF